MAINGYRAYLAQALTEGGSETTIYLDRITTLTGETITTSDFATFGRGVLTINPKADGETSFVEYDSFTAVDSANVAVTGVTRGLSAKGDTGSTSRAKFFPVGTEVIISVGFHNINDLKSYIDDEVAAAAFGTANVTSGIAGETVSQGNLVYLQNDGKWWKTDADTASTVEGVQLGIAQGAGSADGAISGGVLLKGKATNQSGLVAGTEYYASNTAGGISSSAGTTPKKVGVATSATDLMFNPDYGYIPTDNEKDAMAGGGDFGTPSSSNKFVTENIGATKSRKTMTAGATINGATLPVPVYQNKTDNEFYACDANDSNAYKFLGFAISNGTDGNDIDVQFTGIVSGFTGLSEGEKYYVQDAVGTIGTTPGTQEILVGIAISETELLIQKGTLYTKGSFNFTQATADQVITLGFRPSVIRIWATAANESSGGAGTSGSAFLVYANGSSSGIGVFQNSATDGSFSYSSATIKSSSGSNQVVISISSVTDTGFTIVLTETGNVVAGRLLWEAEGRL